MIQCGRGLCLAAESSQKHGVLRQIGAQNLDGHSAGEPGVIAQMHLGHSAATDEVTDFVALTQNAGGITHVSSPFIILTIIVPHLA